jgi:hypothetical protein
MSLLYPEFLWALGLNIIPVIIHLFNLQKHETIYFSDITLLKSIEQETKSISKLKNIILLLIRMLLISSLVMAFCFPFSKENSLLKNKTGITGIYIDNSFSMLRANKGQSLLENAKDDIMNFLANFSENEKFILTTNQKNKNKNYPINKEELIKEITAIKATSNSLNYNEIISLQKEQSKGDITQTYWLTDLHEKDFNFKNSKKDSCALINLIHYQSNNNNNISIDSVWFSEKTRRIDTEEELNVNITNYSNNEVEFQTKLKINNSEVTSQSLDQISPMESKTISFHFITKTNGTKNGVLKISDASYNDQNFDDEYYFTYSIDQDYQVLYLYENELNIKNSLETLYSKVEKTQFKTININKGFTAEELQANLIILDGISTFKKELINGLTRSNNNSNIIFIPPHDQFINENKLLDNFNCKLVKIDSTKHYLDIKNINQQFFKSVFSKEEKNIDLPYFQISYKLNSDDAFSVTPLINFDNNLPLLIEKESNGNKLFLFTSSLRSENSNLTSHALFVPTFLRIKEKCSNDYIKQYKVRKVPLIALNIFTQQNGQLTIVNQIQSPSFSFFPLLINNQGRSFIDCEDQIDIQGHYFVNAMDSVIDSFSVNYNREESDMSFYSPKEINSRIENSSLNKYVKYLDRSLEKSNKLFVKEKNDKQYWKYFVILALIFIALEITLIKLTEKNVF